MLKIKEITIHNIALPLQETIRMSKVIIEKSNSILVKVKSTDDISGWGEAASSLSMTGESAAGMILALEYIKNEIINKEIESVGEIYELIQRSIYGNYAAKSAIEVALVDLLAKNSEKTFSELIGIKQREELPIIWRIAGRKMRRMKQKK